MIRVGFTKIGGHGWQGGHNYLVNLLAFLSEYQSSVVTPVLFVEPSANEDEMSDFLAIDGLDIVRSPAFSQTRQYTSLLKSIVFGRDRVIVEAFRANSIDIVFEVAQFFGWRLGIPAVAWIPDFQHREFPEFFSRFSWWKRELGFKCQIAAGRKLMLSSFDAKKSCEKYYRTKKEQIDVVSFAVPPVQVNRAAAKLEIQEIYGIHDEYFFMPNHFWKHKNHRLVIESLAILKARGVHDVLVVATGNTSDPRDESYYETLECAISGLDIGENFRILGVVPYAHVRSLLAASKGLLNPSLYEGWSTTVEEAKSIGAPTVLSDLPVHKEQASENAVFFDRYSASSLADVLSDFSVSWAGSGSTNENSATSKAKQFAYDFSELIQRVCCHGQGV